MYFPGQSGKSGPSIVDGNGSGIGRDCYIDILPVPETATFVFLRVIALAKFHALQNY